jgi:hypothetical protein
LLSEIPPLHRQDAGCHPGVVVQNLAEGHAAEESQISQDEPRLLVAEALVLVSLIPLDTLPSYTALRAEDPSWTRESVACCFIDPETSWNTWGPSASRRRSRPSPSVWSWCLIYRKDV